MTTRHYGILAAVLVIGAAIARIIAYPVVTSDYIYFLAPWYAALQSHAGLSAFAAPFADYAPLYLYIVKALTLIPIPSLYAIKTVSVIADIIIAVAAFAILRRLYPDASRNTLACYSAIVFALPTVILNGSLWGQSDAIYTSFILLCLLALIDERTVWAVLSFAVALSFKLQAIFFLPILLGYLIPRREEVLYALLIPLLFIASVIPAWLGGGSLSYWLFIYGKQSGEYTGLSVSAQNLFAFTEPLHLSGYATNVLFYMGLLMAAGAALYLMVALARRQPISGEGLVLFAALTTLLLPYVLPRMHERYFFLADIMCTLYALTQPRRWYVAVLAVGASILAYLPYLSQLGYPWMHIDLRIPSVLVLIACIVLALDVVAFMRKFRSA